MSIIDDYSFVLRNINACKTIDHLNIILKLISNFNDKWTFNYRKNRPFKIIKISDLQSIINYRNSLDKYWWNKYEELVRTE